MTPIDIKLTLGGAGEVEAGLRRAGASLDKVGVSAAQTAAALRGVPAQFTDIIVSLQGGQAPLTVFLQQGGQLKDMFGGAGAAAKALSGYVLGLVNPLTVAAGAAAAVAVAHHQGRGELEAYTRAIAMSGNASGVTTSQLGDYAKQLGSVAGTQSQAAAGLAEFTAAGVRGGDELRRFTQTSIEWEKATGEAVGKTAEKFASLQKDPLAGVLKLNEGTNFLTVSVYEQIKALDDQGRKTEASKVAMEALDSAMSQRGKAIEASLGSLERGWRGITGAAKDAWDAMLNVGRAATISDQLGSVRSELAQLLAQSESGFGETAGGAATGRSNGAQVRRIKERIDALRAEEWALLDKADAEKVAAAASEQSARKLQALIEFDKKYQKALEGEKSLKDKLAIARREADAAGKSEADWIKVKTTITEEHNKSLKKGESAQKAYNRELDQQKALIGELSGLSSTFYQDWDGLNKQYAQGRISMEALESAQAALLAKQPAMVAMAKEEAEQQKARIKIYEEETKVQQKLLEHREKEAETVEVTLRKAKEEERAHILAAAAGITHAEALAEIALARAQDSYQKELANGADGETLLALQREVDARRELIAVMGQKGVREASKKVADEVVKDWEKTAQTIGNTLSDYIMAGGKDAATYLKRLFSTLVLQPVVQAVVGGASGVAATAASAAGLDGVAKGLNAASSANSMYGLANGYSSGLNTAAGLFGAGSTAGASAASLGYANAVGAIGGDSLGALIAANGSWGGVAAGSAATGAATGTAAAGSSAGMTSALAAIPGWGWAAMAAVAVASIFGGRGKKETTDVGIAGALGANGVNVAQYTDWKQDGGWFHGDRGGRNLSGLSTEMYSMLSNATTGITQSTRAYAAALGLSADAVNGYTQSIDVSLKDLSAEEQQAAISAALTGFADGMASVYDGVAALALEGEGASTTLARLSVTLTTTNAWLSMLRQRVFQLGLAGGDAASKLADAMGGLENLGAAVQEYYDLYYSESEKAAYSTEQMTTALAAVGVAMPATKDAFRAVADSLDLNTASGRAAYATLLTIAPEFANVADHHARMAEETSRLAQETATQLLEAFSGRQQLIPLLDATLARFDALGAGLQATGAGALDMGNATGWINTQLGNTSSGLLFFGDQLQLLDGGMAGAQLASAALAGEVQALRLNASRTVTDITGLSAALANVNTETFVAAIQGVLTRLGSMFTDLISRIADERVAVRDAAQQIINPTVMSKAAIEREIANSNVGMPSNAGVIAANARLTAADAKVAGFADLAAKEQAYGAKFTAAYIAATGGSDNLETYKNYTGANLVGLSLRGAGEALGGSVYLPSAANVAAGKYGGVGTTASLNVTNPGVLNAAQLSAVGDAFNYVTQVLTPLRASLGNIASAQAEQTAAAAAAKQATLAYVDSLQNYAIDASKATDRLSKLREETVKYYESQKALADLMSKSASTLRQTVADYRYSQLSPEEQFRSLEGQFNTAYAMALSTSGETLAGYADQMSGLLGPMLDKMAEAGYSGNASAIASYLARAEAVAGRVESQTPTNYAADSLTMLGQIDSTLAALEAGSKSAERIISEAINAGRDATVNGLRQVTNALTGRPVSYFADGGAFTNGVVSRPTAFTTGVMGEAGPEGIFPLANVGGQLGVRATGAGGNSAEIVAELRALRQDNANMRAELRAIVKSSAKTARTLDRIDMDGMLVRTDADTPLAMVPA